MNTPITTFRVYEIQRYTLHKTPDPQYLLQAPMDPYAPPFDTKPEALSWITYNGHRQIEYTILEVYKKD